MHIENIRSIFVNIMHIRYEGDKKLRKNTLYWV